MEYTNSQKELLKKINNFFNSDLDIFIIKGYAGTGKTFITKIIIESLQKAKTNFSLMAPTGKATKVLSEKTNEIANTIHSSIYAIDKTDIENKKLYFSLKQNNLVNSYFIVDEASMISNINNETDSLKFGSGKLLKDLLEFVNFSKKNKLILIGDTAQLPPVKMNKSPALLKETFLEYGFKVDDFLMTDVVRQKDNSILENATYLRDKIKDEIFNKIELKYDNKFEKIEENFTQEYLLHKNAIIIAHTNDSVYNYNQQIRKFLYEDINNIYDNETLMIIQNNKFNDMFLANGTFIKVIKVGLQEKIVINLKGRKNPIHLIFRNIEAQINNQTFKTKILENTLFSAKPNLTKDESVALFIDFEQRNKNLDAIDKKEKLKTDPYFNALRVKFAHAITCHKAQGSEWDYIFLDAKYSNSRLSKDYYKWLYTAITRAKEKIFIKNSPDINLFSNMKKDTITLTETKSQTIQSTQDNRFNISDSFLLAIYQKIVTITNQNKIKIITHQSKQYQEVYTFELNDDIVDFSFYYNSKNLITNIKPNKTNITTSLLVNLFESLKGVPIFTEEKNEFSFPEKFLEEFYNELLKRLPENIKIANIKHQNWKERYTFKRDDEIAVIDFFYNGKKQFTKKNKVKANSEILLNDIENSI
jgi:ATP-dependent exoDNAse (exonuclease V) alpha subunit